MSQQQCGRSPQLLSMLSAPRSIRIPPAPVSDRRRRTSAGLISSSRRPLNMRNFAGFVVAYLACCCCRSSSPPESSSFCYSHSILLLFPLLFLCVSLPSIPFFPQNVSLFILNVPHPRTIIFFVFFIFNVLNIIWKRKRCFYK